MEHVNSAHVKGWQEMESAWIDSFFKAPAKDDPPNHRRSNLYVLRRDLNDLLCGEGEVVPNPKAPILAAIGILAGIDFLAWTLSWPRDPGRLHFVNFLVKYGSLSENLAEVLYQFRCAQVHGYGLYSIRKSKNAGVYRFVLYPSPTPAAAITKNPQTLELNCYVISLFPLRELFLRMIKAFEESVRRDPEINQKFLRNISKDCFFQTEGWWTH